MKIVNKKYKQYQGQVFDLSVEDSHSYNVNGCAVHNSAAGSLVLYLLGVTDIDPIPHGLFFERFVSKSRARKVKDKSGKEFLVGSVLPDIDNDISYEKRDKVIEYIEKTHKGRTAKILTFNTFSSKLCIREATKYFDEASEDDAKSVSDLIPKHHGKVASLTDSVREDEKFAEWVENHPTTFQNALIIENLIKNTGVHPSGIAICSQEISNVVPLQHTKEGDLVTGYNMHDVADLMVKFDILGLRTLTIAHKTCKKIGVSLEDINPNDNFIYQILQDFNHPMGLFQISADTNSQVCRDVKPINLSELSDVVALARPSSLQFVDDYIRNKLSPSELGVHPVMDDLLRESKNVFLYQETLMQCISQVFGFSLQDADDVRRIVGKKLVEKMQPWKEKIYNAAREKGMEESVADYFWTALEAAANYSFNKCISPDSIVETESGNKCMYEVNVGEKILAYDTKNNAQHFVEVIDKIESQAELYEVEFEDGRVIKCSMEHKFLCDDLIMRTLKDILIHKRSIICKP